MEDIERCFICDEPTGKAGKHDDSLYHDDGTGPYCDACGSCIVTLKRELADALRRTKQRNRLTLLIKRMIPHLREECRMHPDWKRGEGPVSEEEATAALKDVEVMDCE